MAMKVPVRPTPAEQWIIRISSSFCSLKTTLLQGDKFAQGDQTIGKKHLAPFSHCILKEGNAPKLQHFRRRIRHAVVLWSTREKRNHNASHQIARKATNAARGMRPCGNGAVPIAALGHVLLPAMPCT